MIQYYLMYLLAIYISAYCICIGANKTRSKHIVPYVREGQINYYDTISQFVYTKLFYIYTQTALYYIIAPGPWPSKSDT